MKKVIVVIQARMGSSRFPGKAMLPLCGKPVIQYMVEKAYNSVFVDDVVVAIPDTKQDLDIFNLCYQNGIHYYTGSENDVLQRVTKAAEHYSADVVVDITGDCPLFPVNHIDSLVKLLLASKYDYFGNTLERCWPDGFDVTAVTMNALERLNNFKKPIVRSHTVWNMTQYSEDFSLGGIIASDREYFPKWGLTLDTKEDYTLISHIAEHFKGREDEIGTKDIIDYIKNKPHLLDINRHIIRKEPGEG